MVEFVDTPGLADVHGPQMAAQAINQFLNQAAQQDYRVKIFFVMTLQAGRMKPEDLYTIKQVMSCIVLPGGNKPGPNSYGVIINMCKFTEDRSFAELQKLVQLQLGVASKAVPFTTTYIEYVPYVPDADGAKNATVPCADLLQRLIVFPGIFVQSASPIDVRDWEQRLEDLRKELGRETEQKIKEMEKKHSTEKEELLRNIDNMNAQLAASVHEPWYNKLIDGTATVISSVVPAMITNWWR
ncbi:unnamed protein product [Symbiodinium necroappetens]|uniref:AIG1-type G domain-containing protein n=1 Tax=Symbiodinium necroappetens TaxID=1628268 RepID=A0A812IVJ8_9DINO|nr:unnamed protein product [Symbiodinium necroappetens]